MQFAIIARDFDLSPELSEQIERRLLFALGRFSPHVRSVEARLSKGSRGLARCQILVRMKDGETIAVGDDDHDSYCLTSRSTERVGRAVARAIKRRTSSLRYQRRRLRSGGLRASPS